MRKQKFRFKAIVTGETKEVVAQQLRKLAQEVEQGYITSNVVDAGEGIGSRIIRPMLPGEKAEYQNAYNLE